MISINGLGVTLLVIVVVAALPEAAHGIHFWKSHYLAVLGKAINDKEQPMKLAQTRLDIHTSRQNVELFRDPVQFRLIQEVNEIENSVGNLEARHSNAEPSLKGLIRNQLDLEEDTGVKAVTLFIDEVE